MADAARELAALTHASSELATAVMEYLRWDNAQEDYPSEDWPYSLMVEYERQKAEHHERMAEAALRITG